MESIHSLEIAVSLILQTLGSWLTTPMEALSFLGQEQFYLLLLPVLYWCVDATLGLRVGVMFLLMQFSNTLIKLVLRQPRPFWLDSRVQALSTETSFGMPSGHAQSAVGIWGLLGAISRRRWAIIGAIVLIFLIGFSRVYLGVHFATDVLGGWIIGGLLLWLYLKLESQAAAWIQRIGYRGQITLTVASSLGAMLISLGVVALLPKWDIPIQWAQTADLLSPGIALDPLNLEGIFTITGTWLGMLGGAAWIWRFRGKPAPPAHDSHRLLRYLVGIVGVIALWSGLGALFSDTTGVVGYALRYFRYTLIGLWVSALAPLLFTRLGIGGYQEQRSETLQPARKSL